MPIQKLSDRDFESIYSIINAAAAVAYKSKIPPDCYHEPYMSQTELQREIAQGIQFYGVMHEGELAAVMGLQPVGDVTLIRHAYTHPKHQCRGLGSQLLSYLLSLAKTKRILVGTWQDASWAIRFYQKHGFVLLSREETNRLLSTYWDIPKRQIETSIVLEQWRNP
jgi:GNAT superfamily N-acetyltransferase